MLDEVLELDLSNLARLIKTRPGVNDDHILVQQVANDLWFRQVDYEKYLKNFLNERELAGGMMLKMKQDVNTMSLDKFEAGILAKKAQKERFDAILRKMGVGWMPSFLSTSYPRASRSLIAIFVRDIRKLSIGLVLELYVTFGRENLGKGPANLFTQALADLRLDGLITLITMTYDRLGDPFVLLRYPEQLQGTSRELNALLETAPYRKMKDWRILLIQFLLQLNSSITGENKVASANQPGCDNADRSASCSLWTERVRQGSLWTSDVVNRKAYGKA